MAKKAALLFDHFVGEQLHLAGIVQAEHLGGFEVDDELEFGACTEGGLAGFSSGSQFLSRRASAPAGSASGFRPRRQIGR
jgi:hypothetical protein